jgi:putative oxidoreductase
MMKFIAMHDLERVGFGSALDKTTLFVMKRNTIVEIISTLFILLFVYTASSKLVNLQVSYREMNNQPFPNWLTPYLLSNNTKKAGLWGSLVLMSIFTGYIGAILLNFFSRVPCSCGGVLKQLGWTFHLYFNLFFVLLAIVGLILSRKQHTEGPEINPNLTGLVEQFYKP